jgi:hypothetical protein
VVDEAVAIRYNRDKLASNVTFQAVQKILQRKIQKLLTSAVKGTIINTYSKQWCLLYNKDKRET